MSMNVAEVLDSVRAYGAHLSVEGDTLRVKAPAPLPAELMSALKQHKPTLLTLLVDVPPNVELGDSGDKGDKSPRCATPAALQAHLAILLCAIHEGCRQGLAQHLERTDAEIVRSLLTDMESRYPDLDGYRGRCQKAGAVVALAGLVTDYRTRLRQVEALGGDIFPDAAALELALLYRPQAEEAR